MKDFQYVTPKTLREAVGCLSIHGNKSRILAGGTDLLVQMRGRRYQPEYVIDVKHIPELSELSFGNRNYLKGLNLIGLRRNKYENQVFAIDNRDEALAFIDHNTKLWMRVPGTRGAIGKKTINASSQFNALFEEE